jgi:hypothetical protein
MQSGLHKNLLAHIWDLADMQNRGKLNSDEFAVAMHLIYGKLNGADLPRNLPENLIPPSMRNLKELSDFAKLDALNIEPIKRISPAASFANITTMPMDSKENLSRLSTNERKSLERQVEEKKKELYQIKDSISN